MRKFLLILLFSLPAMAQIPPPQIGLTGNLGCSGFPCVNSGTLIFASDADRTMTAQETSAPYIKVTSSVSLTATRNLIAPAGRFPFSIENATTGGQSIQIIGTSGTGVTIPNGQALTVWNDGTNYVMIGTAANPAPPAFAVQFANSTVDQFATDNSITINPVTHTLTVGGGSAVGTIDMTGNASGLVKTPLLLAPGSAVGGAYTPMYFGAKGDGAIVTDCGITGGSAILTCPTSTPFASTDIGKVIVITGAGPQFTAVHNPYNQVLPTAFVSTIASFQSSSQVTLTSAPPVLSGGLTSITYVSGITASGTGTCTLSAFNNGISGATGSITITAGVITPSILVTAQGTGATSAPTAAAVASGTATCSGTPVLTTTLGLTSVANQWMAFGTDDSAAINSCMYAGPNHGGRCTINNGVIFMYSPTSTAPCGGAICLPNVNDSPHGIKGGIIDGKGTIVTAPQATITAGVNSSLINVFSALSARLQLVNPTISSYSVTSNVVTLVTSTQAFQVGQVVTPNGMTVATFLNGNNYTLTAVTSTSVSFAFTTPDVGSTPDTTGALGIGKGTLSITATNASDISGMKKGDWFEVEESDHFTNNADYIDWLQVSSISGQQINLTVPTRMAWPGTDPFTGPAGLAFRKITNLATGFTVQDITILTPLLTSGTRFLSAITTSATNDFTISNTTCWNASTGCLESNFDRGMKFINNHYMAEAGEAEFAESVDGVYTGNTFGGKADPINQNQDSCTATPFGGPSLTLDLGLGFYTFAHNAITEPCGDGIPAFFGVHDGTISYNSIGWSNGPNAENIGISLGGGYRNVIEGNSLSGALGSVSRGVHLGDDVNPNIPSQANVIINNHVNDITNDYQGKAYELTGTAGTDCATYQTQGLGQYTYTCQQVLPASNIFGATGVLNQTIAGGVFSGLQILFGNISPGAAAWGSMGTAFSSSGVYLGFNSYATASGVDNWHQSSAAVPSGLLLNDNFDGLAYYRAAASTADGTKATFWGTPVFQINPSTGLAVINEDTTITSVAAAHTPLTLVGPGTTGQILVFKKSSTQVANIDINGNATFTGLITPFIRTNSASNTDLAGQIAITSSTTGTYTFSGTYTDAPICQLTPINDPTSVGTYWASTTTTVLTANVHTSGSITFNYHCDGRI